MASVFGGELPPRSYGITPADPAGGLDTVALMAAGPQIDIALRGPTTNGWPALMRLRCGWPVASALRRSLACGIAAKRAAGPLAILHFTTGLDTLDYLPLLAAATARRRTPA